MVSRIVKIACICLGFLIIAGISAYLTLTFIIKGEETVVVPDITGKEVVAVLQLLTDLGLNTKVKGSEYSAAVPVNRVIFQEPKPGAEIKKDRDVRIIISKGPKTVMVPKLNGLSLQQARIILDDNGLCLGNQSRVFDKRVRNEEIVSQTPPSGSRIDRGKCVDLLLSVGERPAAYKMPEFNGWPLTDTFLWMDAVNLHVGSVQAVHLKNRPFDIVVGQVPPAGHRVVEGARVDLKVNKPPDDLGRRIPGGLTGVGLFRYRLPSGFLKRQIRIRLNSFGGSRVIMDELIRPGREVWHLVPGNRAASVLLYEDGALVQTTEYGNLAETPLEMDGDKGLFSLSHNKFEFLSKIYD